MLDFIIKYWVEFLFGIVAAGLLASGRYIWMLFKDRLKDSLEDVINCSQNFKNVNVQFDFKV